MQRSHVKSSVGPYRVVWMLRAGTVKGVNFPSALNPLPSLSNSFPGRLNAELAESAFWDYFLLLRTSRKVVVSFGCLGKNDYIYSLEQNYIVWTRATYWTVVTLLLRDICQQNLKSKHADINRNLETLDIKYALQSLSREVCIDTGLYKTKISVAMVSKWTNFASNQ